MPIKVTEAAGGVVHSSPFVGPIDHTISIRVDVSALDGTGAVDEFGYLKPGVLFQQNGIIINGAAQVAYGACVEAVKVAEGNTTALLGAAADIDVAVALFCVLNRDILEDVLGRVLNANEIAAVDVAGSHVSITST